MNTQIITLTQVQNAQAQTFVDKVERLLRIDNKIPPVQWLPVLKHIISQDKVPIDIGVEGLYEKGAIVFYYKHFHKEFYNKDLYKNGIPDIQPWFVLVYREDSNSE